MKKLMLLLCLVLLVGSVSAFEFDNVRSYNKETKTVEIRNSVLGIPFLELSKITEIQLKTPQKVYVLGGYQRVAEFTLKDYDGETVFSNSIEFQDRTNNFSTVTRDVDYKIKTTEKERVYYTCDAGNVSCTEFSQMEDVEAWIDLDIEDLQGGETTIGIYTTVLEGDKIEWIPTFFGIEIPEWAAYDWVANWTRDVSIGTSRGGCVDEDGVYLYATSTANDEIYKHYNVNSTIISNWDTAAAGSGTPFDCAVVGDVLYSQDRDSDRIYLWNTTTEAAITDYPTTAANAESYGIATNGSTYLYVADYNDEEVYIYYLGNVTYTGLSWDINTSYFAAQGIPFDYVNGMSAQGETLWAVDYGQTYVANFWAGNGTFISEWNAIQNFALTSIMYSEDYFYQTGGTYIKYEGLPSNDVPVVTLNTPVDMFNSSSLTVNFNGTVSDDVTLVNVTLYINNSLNQTNSSGINVTDYLFSVDLSDGYYNWTYGACDNIGQCTNATPRSFTIDSTNPSVTINQPSGAVTNNGTLLLNTTISDTNLNSCWYQYNITTNVTFTCGAYALVNTSNQKNITVWANDSAGNVASAYSTFSWTITINILDAVGNLLTSPDTVISALSIDTSENPLIRDSETILEGIEKRSLLVNVSDDLDYSKDYGANISFGANQSVYNISMLMKSLLLSFVYYNDSTAVVTGFYSHLDNTENFTDDNLTEVLTSLEQGKVYVYWGFNESHPMNYTQYYEFENLQTTEHNVTVTVLEDADTYAYMKVTNEWGDPIQDAIIMNYYSLPATEDDYKLMGRRFTEPNTGLIDFQFESLSSVKSVVSKEGFTTKIERWNPQDETYDSNNPKTIVLEVSDSVLLGGLQIFTEAFFWNRSLDLGVGVYDGTSDYLTYNTNYNTANKTVNLDQIGIGSFTLYSGVDFNASGASDITLYIWRGSNLDYWGEYVVSYRDGGLNWLNEPSGVSSDVKKKMFVIGLIIIAGMLGLLIKTDEENVGKYAFLGGGVLLGVLDYTNFQWVMYTCLLAFTMPIIRRWISE